MVLRGEQQVLQEIQAKKELRGQRAMMVIMEQAAKVALAEQQVLQETKVQLDKRDPLEI